MARQNQAQNVDLFDAYLRRADLDHDGRITGAEAVGFFQGSNLPKNVLAQIWMHADQNRTGYLGRAEFYNALRLVTVAQSKRELTPDIVKAALYGPAAAKIPAPQINLSAIPPSQPSSITATPAPQMGALAPTAFQNPGFRGPQVYPNANMNPQFHPSQANQFMRPPQAMPAGAASLPLQGIPGQVLPGEVLWQVHGHRTQISQLIGLVEILMGPQWEQHHKYLIGEPLPLQFRMDLVWDLWA